VFVDRAARGLLEDKLAGSMFNDEECLGLMIEEFERKACTVAVNGVQETDLHLQTKRIFDGNQFANVIHFGRIRDSDRQYGILRGKLSLTADEVASTFKRTVDDIKESCLKLLRGRKVKVRLDMSNLSNMVVTLNSIYSWLEGSANPHICAIA